MEQMPPMEQMPSDEMRPPWMMDPRYKGYFNPNQLNPFHNPNVEEVANGGLMSLARRRGYAG